MTQQTEAYDRGDDAAEDVATQGTHTYRQVLSGEGKASPGRAIGIDGATPMEMWIDLTQLESAFPAFSFTICKGWDGPRFEAWQDTTPSGLYAIITDDPRELWRELNMAAR